MDFVTGGSVMPQGRAELVTAQHRNLGGLELQSSSLPAALCECPLCPRPGVVIRGTGKWAQGRHCAQALGSVQVTAPCCNPGAPQTLPHLNSVGILVLDQGNLTGNVTRGRRKIQLDPKFAACSWRAAELQGAAVAVWGSEQFPA